MPAMVLIDAPDVDSLPPDVEIAAHEVSAGSPMIRFGRSSNWCSTGWSVIPGVETVEGGRITLTEQHWH
jgi:hypothetical protein